MERLGHPFLEIGWNGKGDFNEMVEKVDRALIFFSTVQGLSVPQNPSEPWTLQLDTIEEVSRLQKALLAVDGVKSVSDARFR